MEIARKVSPVSAIAEVRHFLVAQQQQMGEQKGVVMDGRDIGTVVFPEAELKIFMTASAEIRAKRRYNELTAKGIHVNYQEVLHNIKEREQLNKDFIELERILKTRKKIIAFNGQLFRYYLSRPDIVDMRKNQMMNPGYYIRKEGLYYNVDNDLKQNKIIHI